jgi:arginyl-tRNA synthetase
MTPQELAEYVRSAVDSAISNGQMTLSPSDIPSEIVIERPKNPDHGDWATNIALQISKRAGLNPLAAAEILLPLISTAPGIESGEIAGPGFINIRLSAASQGSLASAIVAQGNKYGQGTSLAGKKINVEFISANPTGPLHLGHTRWAAVGDAIARVLEA